MLPRTPQNRTVKSGLTKGRPPRVRVVRSDSVALSSRRHSLLDKLIAENNREKSGVGREVGRPSDPRYVAFEAFCSNPLLTISALSRGQRSAKRRAAMMSETEYASAVAEFLSKKGITRCPTACIVPTHASVPEADRTALRDY